MEKPERPFYRPLYDTPQERERERREFFEGLGIPPPPDRDDPEAPPVDEVAIGAFVRDEISDQQEHRRLWELIYRNRSWFRSWLDCLERERREDDKSGTN